MEPMDLTAKYTRRASDALRKAGIDPEVTLGDLRRGLGRLQ